MNVRIAAIGDLHVRTRPARTASFDVPSLKGRADILVVAGDLTDNGLPTEASIAAALLARAEIPVVAVFGNHDLRGLRRTTLRRSLEERGLTLLDGDSLVVTTASGVRVGLAGIGGCGGGFWPVEGPIRLSNRAMRALALRTRRESGRLASALAGLDSDVRLAVTHFAPTATTLGREPLAKYWMLGNAELGRVIDRYGVDLAIHGHAHLGCARGATAGGTPVRNVAMPVTGGIAIFEVAVPSRALPNSIRPAAPGWTA